MTDLVIHKSHRFTVTLTDVRSRNDLYTLDAVSHCRVRHPGLIVAMVTILGLSGIVAVWWDDLYPNERLGFGLLSLAALTTGYQLARLELMSLQLRDHTYIWGFRQEIRALKRGIEKALLARSRPSQTSMPNGPTKT